MLIYLCFHLPSCARPPNSDNAKGRLPQVTAWYEGVNTPDLFVLGTAAHARDYRFSAGGFVHGFRYTGEAFHVLLQLLCVKSEIHKSRRDMC